MVGNELKIEFSEMWSIAISIPISMRIWDLWIIFASLGILLQPLPEKQNMTIDRFDKEFIRFREAALHRFLTHICEHPIMSQEKCLHSFLTMQPQVCSVLSFHSSIFKFSSRIIRLWQYYTIFGHQTKVSNFINQLDKSHGVKLVISTPPFCFWPMCFAVLFYNVICFFCIHFLGIFTDKEGNIWYCQSSQSVFAEFLRWIIS